MKSVIERYKKLKEEHRPQLLEPASEVKVNICICICIRILTKLKIFTFVITRTREVHPRGQNSFTLDEDGCEK
jgi:hypothetical protein